MKHLLMIVFTLMILGCATTKELKAPCTFDDRSGCGDLI